MNDDEIEIEEDASAKELAAQLVDARSEYREAALAIERAAVNEDVELQEDDVRAVTESARASRQVVNALVRRSEVREDGEDAGAV